MLRNADMLDQFPRRMRGACGADSGLVDREVLHHTFERDVSLGSPEQFYQMFSKVAFMHGRVLLDVTSQLTVHVLELRVLRSPPRLNESGKPVAISFQFGPDDGAPSRTGPLENFETDELFVTPPSNRIQPIVVAERHAVRHLVARSFGR